MSDKGKAKKSKKLIIGLIIIAVFLLIVIVAMMIVGIDNIKALYYGVKYDNEEINVMIDESSTRLDDKVAEYSYIVARAPTQEEMDAVASGEITDEQLARIIANGVTLEHFRKNNYQIEPYSDDDEAEASSEQPEQSEEKSPDTKVEQGQPSVQNRNDAPKPQQPAENKPAEEPKAPPAEKTQAELDAECDAQVSQIVAKMYILRSSFTSELSALAGSAVSDYKSGASRSEIISNYLSQGQSLEAQCDGNVNALMSELTGILTKYGRTTELVDTIYETYNSEKQYTKAYYMSLYLNN